MSEHEQAKQVVLDAMRAMGGDEDPDALAARVVTADFHNHHPRQGGDHGPEGYAATVRALRSGFPDLRLEVDDVIAEGDRVVVRGWFTGTNDGPFIGPPTGRSVRMAQIHVFRVRDGRIAEHWACMDEVGAMAQLGLGPAQPAGRR